MVSRLITYHIGRLKHASKEIRLEAIGELRLIGDGSALEALENVFRNDVDPDVKKAAQEAGREIYFKVNQKPK
jgi:hypothetical protein